MNNFSNAMEYASLDLFHSSNEQLLNAWLRFIRDKRWSVLQKHTLLRHFSSPEIIYQASKSQLQEVVQGNVNNKPDGVSSQELERDLTWLKDPTHSLLCYNDKRYPELLKEITDPPIALFCKGDLSVLTEPKVAMVGSRRPTLAGVNIAQKIGQRLAELGIVVTSGMALGIDAVAHKSALDNMQQTIAVMGSGLDSIAPARHRALFRQISEQGLLVSEYPLGYPASRYTFPQRNRIVSGLSYGVVIVEAAQRSGTLITARLAMEQDREVFVVPGSPLNPQYKGSHELIRQGAVLTSCVNDILQVLAIPLQSAIESSQAVESHGKNSVCKNKAQPLLEHVGYEVTSIDEIIFSSGLTANEVSAMLLALELDGAIAVVDGGYLRLR